MARGAFFAGAFVLCPRAFSSEPLVSLNTLMARKDLVRLPAKGTMLVVNDFHASFSDYKTFINSTKVFERIEKGEDLYLVINGDIVDYKPNHSEINGDLLICDDLIIRKKSLAAKGRAHRLVLLTGNHEDQALALYETINFKKDLKMPGKNYDRYIRYKDYAMRVQYERQHWGSLGAQQKGGSLLAFASQFDFGKRMTAEHYDFCKTFGMAAHCENGLFITHASYPRIESTNRVYDMIWERNGDGDNFLARTGCEMIINGHTVPSLFKSRFKGEYDADRKLAHVGKDRVIIAPSFHGGGGGTYLKMDLSKIYRTQKDLITGAEVIPLAG